MIDVDAIQQQLVERALKSDQPAEVLKATEFAQLYATIRELAPSERAAFGKKVNDAKQAVERVVAERELQLTAVALPAIDVTAPMDVNAEVPRLLLASQGSLHPITQEIEQLSSILQRMGFRVYGSREIDDQYHMFETLNFPKGHPARDDYDTFMTVETDANGDQLIAPAHTSTMQNRILRELKPQLEAGEAIAATAIDRCFRNEDLDARHEHTFYQHEGIYVDKGVHAGMLVATLQKFLEEYFGKKINVRVNPFYFPFTEPSFEFSLSCPFEHKNGEQCKVCSGEGWIELLGCGMIHPNVLRAADIDPEVYTGFAWGGGVERLIMMKKSIEDIRHFESAKLDFLRQF
ncbi:MAG: phenylalanine--tRNA ligase subunit alpha [Candidatus Saccharimonas sp.]